MKTFLLFITAAFALCFGSKDENKSGFSSFKSSGSFTNAYFPSPLSLPEIKKIESKDHESTESDTDNIDDTDQDWYSAAMENIEKEEYNISYNEKLGTYQSPNRANNVRFTYHKDGFTAETRDARCETEDARREMDDVRGETQDAICETQKEWSIKFKLVEVKSVSINEQTPLTSLLQREENDEIPFSGNVSNIKCQMSDERSETFEDLKNQNSPLCKRGAGGVLSKESQLSVAGNKASIEDDNIRIDYTNDKEGMRQDFIIKNKPEGEGKLRLNISADTKLKMIVGADALMFKDKDGVDQMKYSALKCWDANGVELRAYFEEQFQITNSKLQIENQNKQIPNSKSEIPNKKNSKSEIPNSKFSIVVNDAGAAYPITIDPLSTSPSWVVSGTQTSSRFGNSVSTAGDVNGDGYSDVIIGAYTFSSGQNFEGKAYVFHGSATGLSLVPDWTAESNQDGAIFGNSVSTAGDVNGDGYSDVIVGAPQYNNDTINEGRAYVYHGSPSGLSDSADWTAEGDQVLGQFGGSVSTAGDVNGDGYSDVIVGARNFDNGETDEGRTYVFHGSVSGLSDSAVWTAESNQPVAFFGKHVSSAGDVNGDGYSDVIVGAHFFDNGETNEGRAFAYYGSSEGLSDSADWTAEINKSGAQFGYRVSTAGDVNGDGYSDVIIGAAFYSNEHNFEGKAILYHGSSSGLESSPAWEIESNSLTAQFGYSVSTAGDVNGDGYSDVIVGAPEYDNAQNNLGKAFLYLGSPSGLDTSSAWAIEGNSNLYYGSSVSTAGDINGDGFSDVIVGAFAYSDNTGRAYVYNGSAAGLSASAFWNQESNQPNAQYGYSVSAAGDVNGDGYSDVIVGAPYFDNGETDEGKVFVYSGSGSGLLTIPDIEIESNVTSARFGSSVSAAGDVNGDGYSDVIIGAENYTNGETNEGKAFIYTGSSSGLTPSVYWSAESNQANSKFGYSVSTAGDVNGDGFSDVIVGANLFDNGNTDEGKAFVYHGSSAGPSLIPDWTYESNQANANFGNSVSTAGDVNGDGYSDVIIGAYNYSNGHTNEGRAFIFYGQSSGLTLVPLWTVENNQAGSVLGWSVSTAGDVNGDGFSDVIIGARNFDNGQTDEGKIYVYAGNPNIGILTLNFTAESNQANAFMGWSVSSAGDVNGDGYSEVLASIRNFDGGQTDEGAVNMYYGSPSGVMSTPVWHLESNVALSYFGHSVSSAGDVNGDGYSDVIVGSHLYSNKGKAYTFYGNDGTGMRSNVQQYEPGTNQVVSSGGLTGTNGAVKLNIFGKSPFGRSDGKIVYEYKENGIPFSETPITNSTGSSGSGNFTDLGTGGTDLFKDISGIPVDKEYKWRARVEYSLVNNPHQKYGPWKYYTNYIPEPFGGFKAQNDPIGQSLKTLSLTVFIQGFFNASTNLMIPDTATVYLRNSASPFALADSSKGIVTSDGDAFFMFQNANNNTPYYVEIRHRNSIETWSKTPQQFTGSNLTYSFSQSASTAYGDNQIEVKPAPSAIYAVYSGDENQDGTVDLIDVVNVFNDGNAFVNGYVSSDMNGDNVTDLIDVVITFNNANAFVIAMTP